MTQKEITVLMVELDKTDGEGARSLQQRFLVFGRREVARNRIGTRFCQSMDRRSKGVRSLQVPPARMIIPCVSNKKVNTGDLMYREGKKVVSQYIRKENVKKCESNWKNENILRH